MDNDNRVVNIECVKEPVINGFRNIIDLKRKKDGAKAPDLKNPSNDEMNPGGTEVGVDDDSAIGDVILNKLDDTIRKFPFA